MLETEFELKITKGAGWLIQNILKQVLKIVTSLGQKDFFWSILVKFRLHVSTYLHIIVLTFIRRRPSVKDVV